MRRRRRDAYHSVIFVFSLLSRTLRIGGFAPLQHTHYRLRRHCALSKKFQHVDTPTSSASPPEQPQQPPIPVMPSDMFRQMAQSQLELLANSLSSPRNHNPSKPQSKVQSMILYLPAENVLTGQLEFTPAVLYPDPSTERVFIASDAASGQAPTLPKTLTKLPGFSHA